ncbi:hypothetical protein FNV43_RR09830 [Rhamnella rubrinervis]|uniref:Uncharacterized protein n=1 Tax=Rhamnella rubrinervis TaxID=2594499 RepID=A0A8K0MK57_9ROSA|nr:hypothetical protein FNV43_RR09830 [Rhamnella rubrinervis]
MFPTKMSSEEPCTPYSPHLVFLDFSSDSTPSPASASSLIRVIKLNQVANQNLVPHVELTAGRDDPDEHRPRLYKRCQQMIKAEKKETFHQKEGHLIRLARRLQVGYWLSEHRALEANSFEQRAKPIPEGITLPILEVPYTRVLEGWIRLIYGEPSDPLWASYPTVDMGKMGYWPSERRAIDANSSEQQAEPIL